MFQRTPLAIAAVLVAGLTLAACGDNLSATSDVCGDGDITGAEQCDDMNTAGGDGCSSTCTTETGNVCGDGVVGGTEVCDGADLDGETCVSRGFPGGTLACEGDCMGFDESGCDRPPGCGDGVLAAPEECDDGNAVAGDGCELNCQIGVGPVTTCQVIQPLASGVCEVTAGTGAKLITGTILTPDKVWRGGQVLVDAAGAIACTGCDCSADPDFPGATAVYCPGGVVSPGLINPHDHITFTQNSPYTDTGERYEHRHDWRVGNGGHTEINASGGASSAQIRWGELRFLLGGATSTVGSGSATGLLRNLDTNNQEGLGQPPVEFETFPLGDSNGVVHTADCNYPNVVTPADIAGETAYFPHVAEGINQAARNEFVCLSSDPTDIVIDKSAFIHGIALQAPDIAQMAVDSTTLIWSPRSNITLYGDTAQVTEAARAGVLIALGTDWTPTGSMNLLRELACADSLNSTYYDGYFTDADLWRMVTINPAIAAAMEDAIGSIAIGRVADLTIFDGATGVDHRAVIAAAPEDVVLVMRAGEALYGDDAVITGLGAAGCDVLPVCGVDKRVCLMGDIGQTLAQLQTAAGAIYPAFFCGAPTNEPSCVPTRPVAVNGSSTYDGTITGADPDGDGIIAGDDCPMVFNPIRPVDNGAQPDFDADGEGDACDVCPLDADSTTCTPFDPLDPDGDGVQTGTDNCPTTPNPGQEDADSDGKGDACDPCPNTPNPGANACPATIYQIKDGTVAAGTAVSLLGALVTGRNNNGFFVQVKETDAGYAGPDNSGVFVFASGNTVAAGDRVDIATATVADFFGQIQLGNTAGITVLSSGESPPAPIVETAANVATGGSRATALEAVIVRVNAVSVTDINPPPGPADTAPTNEFVVAGSLRVNDYLYLITPFPTVGTAYTSLTGVLEYRNNNSKLELRGAGDVGLGAPVLTTFGPTGTFARVGATDAPTIPTAITVGLSSPAEAPTFVAVTSGDPTRLTVTGGGVTIPTGAASAPVLVTGVATGGVTLTATLAAAVFMTNVTVIDAAQVPNLVGLAPATATVGVGGAVTMTVTLDVPAPAGGTVVDLAVAPAGVGTTPATVTVPADQLSATFDFVGSAPGTAAVTASLGAATFMSMIDVTAAPVGALVINEVDYDQIGTDNAEYIELYNASTSAVDLTNLAVVLVNGGVAGNPEYRRTNLVDAGASLPAGGYLVIHNPGVVVATGALEVVFTGAMDNVQNGAPDAIALVDTAALTILDALSYEGAITSSTIMGFPAGLSVSEGTPTAAADSNTAAGALVRLPNGSDTDDAATDWAFSSTLTPGAPNVP